MAPMMGITMLAETMPGGQIRRSALAEAHWMILAGYARLSGRSLEHRRVVTVDLTELVSVAAFRDGALVNLATAAPHGERQPSGDPDELAESIRASIGATLAILRGADTIVFGRAEDGEDPERELRATQICAGFAWCGLLVESGREAALLGRGGRISWEDSRLQAWIVPVEAAERADPEPPKAAPAPVSTADAPPIIPFCRLPVGALRGEILPRSARTSNAAQRRLALAVAPPPSEPERGRR